jgi:hypothetical protein
MLFPVRASIMTLGLAALTQTACTTAHVHSIGDLPLERGKPVHAEADNWIVLLQGTNNDANVQAMNSLAQQCPDSAVKVSMVENRYQFWLLSFLFKEKISAYGYCEK